jgi:asparagine synthase (glutamine-hydrolysing)
MDLIAMQFTGDLLVLFENSETIPPSRFNSAPWITKKTFHTSQIWACAPSQDWKGFPIQEKETGEWKIYVLGEIRNALMDDFPQSIPSLNGQFLLIAYEKNERKWHAWTDRFGTLHLYYCRGALGTFSPSVARFSTRKLDWHALAGFFGFGFFPGDRTHYEDVSIAQPASHYVFDEQGNLTKQEKYWHWHHQPDLHRSYDDTLAGFASIFDEVMTESADGRTAIPLSGGLDSRSSVVPLSSNSKNNYWAYSYGYSDDSIETRIAGQIAAARHLPFEAFTIQPYLFENIERILAWTEGFVDITQPRQAAVRDQIADHADVLIAALWGDVWFDDMGLTSDSLTNEQVTSHALDMMKKNGRFWLLRNLVQPQLAKDDPEALINHYVQNAMQPLEHIPDPDFRVKAFKTDNWSFRWSLAPIRIFQSAASPRLVFYDQRITDFFQTVPSNFLVGRQFQIDYLKRFAPDLARISWQVYDANLHQYQWFNTLLLPKRILNKLGRMLRGKKVLQRNWEVQFLSQQGKTGLENWLLKPGLHLHEFLSPAQIKMLLEDLYRSPKASDGYTISMLLTFSAWLEKYG